MTSRSLWLQDKELSITMYNLKDNSPKALDYTSCSLFSKIAVLFLSNISLTHELKYPFFSIIILSL